jgi:hypothetical protein
MSCPLNQRPPHFSLLLGALDYADRGHRNDKLIDMSYIVGLIDTAKDRRRETVSGLGEIGSLQ